MVKKFINFFNFQGVIIFINNLHKKEIAFDYLLSLKNIECIHIYKNKPDYETGPKKIILNNFLFYIFVFLSCFKKKSKKILIFSQPIYSLPYIFFGHFLNVYFYDVHIGLNYTSKIKLFLEKFSLLFFKKIIHRDLRLWVEYKKIIKKKNRKNFLLPDFIKNNENNLSKNIGKEIKCAVIGWVDDKFVRVDKSVEILAKLGIHVYFFCPNHSFKLSILNIKSDTNLMNYIHHVGYIKKDEELKKFLKDFSIGICPHDAKEPKISDNYKFYCSSMRIIDYIENYLTVFLSKKTFFQKFILKKYNANYFDIKLLNSFKSIYEIKKILQIKEIKHDNSIFNKKKLSIKLIKFLNY